MHRFLDPADIRRLKNYEFGAKALVEGCLAGRHRSRQRGSSIEFHEFRQYSPGDDPNRIDWRVFARNDKLFLRTFGQETNLECHIFLDGSASMGFPEHSPRLSKLEYASFFSAALAWWVISKNNRVSLTLFDQGIRKHLPAGSTRRHLNDLLQTLENNTPGSGTSITEALSRAQPLLKRKGTLVILSDFFEDPATLFRALNPYLHRGFRILLYHLLDPAELTLEPKHLSRFTDVESGRQLTLHAPSLQHAWNQEILAHSRTLRALASSRQVDYTLTPTNTPWFAMFDPLRA